jgi:ribonuclease D
MSVTRLIDSRAATEALARDLEGATLVAIDTEFVRERTYYPKPCLLQIAWDDRIACVDLMRLPDIDPLGELLFGDQAIKVFHAARQDLELFYSITGKVPAPVYDTQIAGGLLGFPDQAGYSRLVEETLGVRLEKQHARTDWTRRPLSEEQIHYAVDDVRYLLPMREILEDQLAQAGRQGWTSEFFDALVAPDLYAPDPEGSWRRVKNWRQLAGATLARLQALAAWREEQAVRRDRPRRWILADDALVALARHNPGSLKALSALPLPAAVVRHQGESIVRLLAAIGEDAQPREVPPDERLERPQARLASRLGRVLDERAAAARVAPSMIATRSELRSLVRGRRDLPLLRGWRLEIAGAEILRLLSDEASDQPAGSASPSAESNRS